MKIVKDFTYHHKMDKFTLNGEVKGQFLLVKNGRMSYNITLIHNGIRITNLDHRKPEVIRILKRLNKYSWSKISINDMSLYFHVYRQILDWAKTTDEKLEFDTTDLNEESLHLLKTWAMNDFIKEL